MLQRTNSLPIPTATLYYLRTFKILLNPSSWNYSTHEAVPFQPTRTRNVVVTETTFSITSAAPAVTDRPMPSIRISIQFLQLTKLWSVSYHLS